MNHATTFVVDDDPSLAPDYAIVAAFPAHDPLHNKARIALLQVLHAGQWAEALLPDAVNWIAKTINDPPYSLHYSPDDEPLMLARAFRRLAAQLERASATMRSLQPSWQHFSEQEPPDAIGVRHAGQGDAIPPTDGGEAPPF